MSSERHVNVAIFFFMNLLCDATFIKKKIATFMWRPNDTFRYMFKPEPVTLVSLKVPSGNPLFFLFQILLYGCLSLSLSLSLTGDDDEIVV